MVKKILTHPLFAGSSILIFGSLLTNAVNYLYHVILGRALGPQNYGVLASLYSILYIISIVPLSTSLSIVKFISSADDIKQQRAIYQTIRTLIVKVSLAGALVILLLSPIIAKFLHIPNILNVAIIAPVFIFSLITLVNQATSQGRLKFMGMVLPNTSMSIVKLVLGIVLVALGFAVTGAMFGVLAGVVFAFFVSRPYVSTLTKMTKNTFNLYSFFRYSTPVFIQAIAFTSLISTDVILVKHFFSEFDAGLYAAVSTLGKIIYFAAQPVTGAMFPMISKKVAAQEAYLKIFVISLLTTTGIAFIVLAFYTLFPVLAITLLYGQKYVSAANTLFWIGSFYTLYTIAYFFTNFFLSKGRTSIAFLAIIIAILQVVLISLFHTTLLSVIQISLSLMIILCIMLLVYFYFDRKNR